MLELGSTLGKGLGTKLAGKGSQTVEWNKVLVVSGLVRGTGKGHATNGARPRRGRRIVIRSILVLRLSTPIRANDLRVQSQMFGSSMIVQGLLTSKDTRGDSFIVRSGGRGRHTFGARQYGSQVSGFSFGALVCPFRMLGANMILSRTFFAKGLFAVGTG